MKRYAWLLFMLSTFSVAAQNEVALLRDQLSSLPFEEQIDSLNHLGYDFLISHSDELTGLYESYIPMLEDEGLSEDLGKFCANLSLLYYFQGKYDKNLAYAFEAIRIFDSLDMKLALAEIYAEVGYGMKRRDMKKAFYYMRKGMRLLEKIGDTSGLAKVYDNYGVLHEMDRQTDSAIFYYRKALKNKNILKDSIGIPFSLNKLFTAFLVEGQYDSAWYYLNISQQIRERIQDQSGLMENLAFFGDYYFSIENFDSAVYFYEKSLQQAQEQGYTYLVQYSYQQLSSCYEKKGNYTKALECFKKYKQFSDSLVNAETNKAMARLEVKFETEKKEKQLAESRLKLKQRNYYLAGLAMLILFVSLVAWQTYRQQKFKQAKLIEENRLKDQLAEVELKTRLQDERLRISRDLHDNIGSQLTFIISSLDNLDYSLKGKDDGLKKRLGQVNEFSRQTIAQFRDTIWAINKNEITASDLQSKCADTLAKARYAKKELKIHFLFEWPDHIIFDSEAGINIYRIFQETLNNAMKHSGAEFLDIHYFEKQDKLFLEMEDNGCGFDPETVQKNNGLMNMQKRAAGFGAGFEIDSKLGAGTMIRLTLDKNKAKGVSRAKN